MKNTKTKKRNNFKLYFLALVSICLIIFTFFVVNKYNKKHRLNENEFIYLLNTLKNNNFDNAKKTSGCGRTQVKYGAGAKLCSITISDEFIFLDPDYNDDEKKIEEINKKIVDFYEVVDKSLLFKRDKPLPKIYKKGEGFNFGGIYLKQKSTNNDCGSNVYYDRKDSVLNLSVFCDDTGIIDSFFRNGQFSF